MCRVAIIGNAGGGKSTLSRKLSQAQKLPLYSVDKIQWKPNWVETPQEDLNEILESIVKKDLWIIDGWGPWNQIEKRFEEADTIIFVDQPIWRHYWWMLKRQILAFVNPGRVDCPTGCNYAKVTHKLLRMIWIVHTRMKPRLEKLVESQNEAKTVFHIRSPRDLKSFELLYCQ